jgi:o-succinylbenzoate---CoA ligase
VDRDLILLNPRLPLAEREYIEEHVRNHQLGDHVWVMSSGTESQRGGRYKMVALSKTALQAAARGVNQIFSITDKDVIYNTLPSFHVAGLLQAYRAQLSGAKHIQAPELTWNVEEFCQNLLSSGSTVTSLVPTQIYDLVQAQKKAPAPLRCVFAGGGPLTDFLFQQAQALGWAACKNLRNDGDLGHGCLQRDAIERLASPPAFGKMGRAAVIRKSNFTARVLLTGYLLISLLPAPTPVSGTCQWLDPKQQGWFESDDRGMIENDELLLFGRESELVKIKGESVSLAELNDRWQRYSQEKRLFANSVIVSLPTSEMVAKLFW